MKYGLLLLLAAAPALAYQGGSLKPHTHASTAQGGSLGDVTATKLTASSGVYTNGSGVSNTYGAVLVSSGELAAISTSNISGTNIFRVYGASGNAIAEFNQNSASDLGQVFRIWNNAGTSVLTIQGTGGITTNAGISQNGNALQTGTGQANFNNSGGNSFKSQLTIVKSSLTIVDSGIYAASGTFTNGVTAASFTLTSVSGIVFSDGSTQTKAYSMNISSTIFPATGNPTFTNTSAAGCTNTSTTTLTTSSGNLGVICTTSVSASAGVAGNILFVTHYMDAVTLENGKPGSGATGRACGHSASGAAGQPVTVTCSSYFPPVSAAAHNFCAGLWTNGGTETLLCDTVNAPTTQSGCRTMCMEIK